MRTEAEHRVFGVVYAAVTAGLLSILGYSVAVTPEAIERGVASFWPACPYRALLHADCPTCGMTRAFSALAHGRVDDARRYNAASPYGALAVIVLIGVGISQTSRSFRRASDIGRRKDK